MEPVVEVGGTTVVQWRMLEPEQIGQGTAVTQHWALGPKKGKESVGVSDWSSSLVGKTGEWLQNRRVGFDLNRVRVTRTRHPCCQKGGCKYAKEENVNEPCTGLE